jgi:hypothetical protein
MSPREYLEELPTLLPASWRRWGGTTPSLVRMREAGAVTAARYTRSHTRDALSCFYQGVCT